MAMRRYSVTVSSDHHHMQWTKRFWFRRSADRYARVFDMWPRHFHAVRKDTK